MTNQAMPGIPDPREPLAVQFHLPIHELFFRQSARTPETIAVSCRDGAWSYAAVASASRTVAARLGRVGVRRGDVVAVFAHRGGALVPALLGTLRAGAAFTLLDPSYPSIRLADQVRAVRPRAVLALEAAGSLPMEVTEVLRATGCPAPISIPASLEPLFSGSAGSEVEDVQGVALGRDDVAYIAFTSGSTGRPKGIVGLHGPLPHFVGWHARTFGFSGADRFAMLSGLAHDILLRDVFTPVCIGASLHVPPNPRDPDLLRQWLWKQKISVIHLTPSLGQMLVLGRSTWDALPDLRYAFFGGESVHGPLLAPFRDLAPAARVVTFYGATETPQAVGYHVVEEGDDAAQTIPIGRGIDGVQLLVISEDGQLARPGQEGEICVRTPNLAREYLDDAVLTASRFVVNPFTGDPADRIYRTGDLGRYRDDGVVEFAGRSDDQVKIRGFRVELGEIESVLQAHPAVAQAVVVLRADAGLSEDAAENKVLVAYVVAKGTPPAQASVEEWTNDVRDHLKNRLPGYMVPAALVRLEAFPLSPNGKVDRKALPAPGRTALTAAAYAQPSDALEADLAAIWRRLLVLEQVGIDDRFFDIGGNSLLAVQLAWAIEKKVGHPCSLRTLFETGTIRTLAARLRTGSAEVDGSGMIVELQGGGAGPQVVCICGIHLYQQLADRLAPEFRTYGIYLPNEQRIFDEASGTPVGVSVEEMAAGYVRAVRAQQPHGPYLLVGVSFGGVLAYEIAQQLVQEGERSGWWSCSTACCRARSSGTGAGGWPRRYGGYGARVSAPSCGSWPGSSDSGQGVGSSGARRHWASTRMRPRQCAWATSAVGSTVRRPGSTGSAPTVAGRSWSERRTRATLPATSPTRRTDGAYWWMVSRRATLKETT